MKKKLVGSLVAVAMIIGLVGGCGSSGSPAAADSGAGEGAKTEQSKDNEAADKGGEMSEKPAGEEKDDEKRGYRFTWVNPIVGLEYWSIAEEGMAAADEKYGTDTQTVGPTEINIDEQIKQIDAAVAAKVDGIITMALDPEAFKPAIDRAVDAGIPVVCIDTDAPDSKRQYYAGTSNFDAGMEAGNKMAELTGGKAKIGILMGGINAANMVARVEGFKEAIKEFPDMEVIVTEDSNADLLTGTQKAQAMMQTYPEMNAVFGTSSTDAQAAGKVAEEMGVVEDYCIIGFDDMEDTLQYIRDGVVDATTVQKPYEMGYLGVELLVQTIEGNGPAEQIIDTGVTIVTKENVDNYK